MSTVEDAIAGVSSFGDGDDERVRFSDASGEQAVLNAGEVGWKQMKRGLLKQRKTKKAEEKRSSVER